MTQPKTKRPRGHKLTDKGWKKIWDAITAKFPDRPTLQAISDLTDPAIHPESVYSVSRDTVSNILYRRAGADPEKIKSLFKAFGLQLDANDSTLTLKSKSDLADGEGAKSFALPEKIAPVTHWVGRSDEIDTLKSQILHPEIRAVCIVGLGGIGKTTLASQLVRQLQAENAHFTVAAWETLRSPTGKAPRFDTIIDSLLLALSNGEISAATTQNDYRQKTEMLVRLLKKQPCLVILDNVETVLHTGEAQKTGYFADDCFEYQWLFQQLVETEHQSKVIFTSRESLAELSGIAVRELPLKGLENEEAVNLLKSHKQCLNLIATSAELVLLAERYQGHPKALEVVSGVIRNEPKFKGQVGKFLGDREWRVVNTLNGLIDEVFIRLSNLEITCLSRISVYQTAEYPLDTAGIAAQMPEVSEYELEENIIQGLRRRQLLDYEDKQESYQMHPLIQEKAYRLLHPNPKFASAESQLANRQAYRYFLSIPLKTEADWQEIDDIKPLLRAHYHGCCAEDWDEAVAAISGVYDFLRLGFYFQNLKYLYSNLIPPDWREGKQLVTCPEVNTDILRYLGVAYLRLGQCELSHEYLSQSLSASRVIKNYQGEASSLYFIGEIYADKANYLVSLEYFKQSLVVAKKNENKAIECQVIGYEGAIHYYLGDTCLGIKKYQEALDIARQINFREEEVSCLIDLGFLYNYLGDYTSAINCINEYLSLPDYYKGTSSKQLAQVYLANIYFNKGDESTARQFAKNALDIEKKLGSQVGTDAFISFGITHRFFEDLQESLEYFEKRFNRAKEIDFKFDEAWALYQLGMTYRKLGQHDSSLEHFHKSLSIFQQIGTPAYEADSLLALAKTSLLINTVPLKTIQDYSTRAEKICLALKLPLLTEVQKLQSNLQENRD